MTTPSIALVEPGVAQRESTDETRFVAAIECWVLSQDLPDAPVRWDQQGGGRVVVSGVHHLSQLVTALSDVGSWGVVERLTTAAWAQTMRVRDGWIIEVDGGSGLDAFARRARRKGTSATEVVASPTEVARVLWTWLRGRLPADYELREIIDGVD